jgi:hypothetical protein
MPPHFLRQPRNSVANRFRSTAQIESLLNDFRVGVVMRQLLCLGGSAAH